MQNTPCLNHSCAKLGKCERYFYECKKDTVVKSGIACQSKVGKEMVFYGCKTMVEKK